ncbi:hypothetical protein Tco_0259982 [Tanacetum coccineum]
MNLPLTGRRNPEEDPEEDLANYLADEGDDEEEAEVEEAFEEDEDEEEHLALAESAALPAIDPVPSAEEIKPFETDEFTTTPPLLGHALA